jgi:hypothetical protein
MSHLKNSKRHRSKFSCPTDLKSGYVCIHSLVVAFKQIAQYTSHTAIILLFHVLEKNYLQRSLIFLLSSITIYNFKTPDKMLTVLLPPPMLLLPTA